MKFLSWLWWNRQSLFERCLQCALKASVVTSRRYFRVLVDVRRTNSSSIFLSCKCRLCPASSRHPNLLVSALVTIYPAALLKHQMSFVYPAYARPKTTHPDVERQAMWEKAISAIDISTLPLDRHILDHLMDVEEKYRADSHISVPKILCYVKENLRQGELASSPNHMIT
jgi:hypothetical protein